MNFLLFRLLARQHPSACCGTEQSYYCDQCGSAIVSRPDAKKQSRLVRKQPFAALALAQAEPKSTTISPNLCNYRGSEATLRNFTARLGFVLAGSRQDYAGRCFHLRQQRRGSSENNPRTKQPPAADGRLPKSINNATCLAQRERRTCHRWIK